MANVQATVLTPSVSPQSQNTAQSENRAPNQSQNRAGAETKNSLRDRTQTGQKNSPRGNSQYGQRVGSVPVSYWRSTGASTGTQISRHWWEEFDPMAFLLGVALASLSGAVVAVGMLLLLR
jgi:hypothetical protein